VLAEVNNTFGETHRYLLQVPSEGAATCIKQMHVSPFCQPTGHYRFRFQRRRAPRTASTHDDDGLLIRTTLSGRAGRRATARWPPPCCAIRC
jgi:DUF1365 family protein